MRVFVDSDVVISSLLSSSGAASFLLNQMHIRPVISSVSNGELLMVVKRMDMGIKKLEKLLQNRFEVFKITKELQAVKKEYGKYVTDINDAHIVAGAHVASVKFLLSYNLKHFRRDLIKSSLDLVVLTPALFLQYLRSQK